MKSTARFQRFSANKCTQNKNGPCGPLFLSYISIPGGTFQRSLRESQLARVLLGRKRQRSSGSSSVRASTTSQEIFCTVRRRWLAQNCWYSSRVIVEQRARSRFVSSAFSRAAFRRLRALSIFCCLPSLSCAETGMTQLLFKYSTT